MTLRLRLSLSLAIFAAISAFGVAYFAYSATSSELTNTVDASLTRAANNLAHGPLPGSRPVQVQQFGGPPHLNGLGQPFGIGGIFQLAQAQFITAHGKIYALAGQVRLPVQARDLQIARHQSGAWLRTETADSVTYRILTIQRPSSGAIEIAQNITSIATNLSTLRGRFTLFGLLAAALGGAIGLFVATALGRPLRRLSRVAQHIAATGDLPSIDDLESELDTTRSDETGVVARSFTAMLSALRKGQHQQQRLVHDASHELRTPLTSLQANVELLTSYHDELSDVERHAVLEDLRSEMSELTSLIAEIVEVATEGQSNEEISRLDLSAAAQALAERYRQRSGRPITVRQPAEGALSVYARQRSIERCISNLLDNAIKFSPPSSEVTVELSVDHVIVTNESPPIPSADLPHIFDRFYRTAASRALKGSGLGLSIVNDIVTNHQGRCFARNTCIGGVNFVQVGFHLPHVTLETPDTTGLP